MTSSVALGLVSSRPPSNELTLDQLLAEPIVQQLMRRDGIDEATTRRLLQQVAAARAPSLADTLTRLLHSTVRLWCKRHNKEVRVQCRE